MTPTLVHCIYTSCERYPMSPSDIESLVDQSRAYNKQHGITGILLHAGGCFMQVLEGDPRSVGELYAKILRDPRHTRITRIIWEAVPHRFFAKWTMGSAIIGSMGHILVRGDAAEGETPLPLNGDGRAKKLLRAFSDGRWRSCLRAVPELVAA